MISAQREHILSAKIQGRLVAIQINRMHKEIFESKNGKPLAFEPGQTIWESLKAGKSN